MGNDEMVEAKQNSLHLAKVLRSDQETATAMSAHTARMSKQLAAEEFAYKYLLRSEVAASEAYSEAVEGLVEELAVAKEALHGQRSENAGLEAERRRLLAARN